MNGSVDKYTGFPVYLNELVEKIYQINPNYSIKYYDDEITKNDVLVAYVENKKCVHRYLSHCETNLQPPGLADFLRGTITLYNLSKQYNYDLYIDTNHIIFKYLTPNDHIINEEILTDTIEAIPPMSYNEIYNKLHQLFIDEKSFSVLTNSFYTDSNTGEFNSFGAIEEDCRNFMIDVFKPNEEILNKINYLFENVYNINKDEYFETIHLRCGDNDLHQKSVDFANYNLYYNKIKDLTTNNPDIKYIFISDSSEIANKIKQDIPELCYWDNSKVHLGDLTNFTRIAVLDTLVDFFVMTKSQKINAINDSGFSKSVSVIYNIVYNII